MPKVRLPPQPLCHQSSGYEGQSPAAKYGSATGRRRSATTLFLCSLRLQGRILALNPDDQSEVRRRIEGAAQRNFIRLDDMGHMEVLRSVLDQHLDILIDLDGYSGSFFNHGLLTLGLAPVQVNFLGYPGTLGAPAVPYIISDHATVPPSSILSVSERVVNLPHCLMATKRWHIPPLQGGVAGLENKFVLGSFHKQAKLHTSIFSVWRNMGKRIAGSVLWVTRISEKVQEQLQLEAQSHGLNSLLVHDQIPTEDMMAGAHLAARSLADLAMDTPIYNGHTTVAELLWSGVPTISCPGQATMAARLATSLLTTIGMPALSSPTLKSYEDLGIALAMG